MAHYVNDGNYYRAYVVRVESKANIQIKYMDYGNDANVKFEHLFELPDELKEVVNVSTAMHLLKYSFVHWLNFIGESVCCQNKTHERRREYTDD